MADPAHLATLRQGPEAWNAWRSAHPDVVPDLEGADLQGANLLGVRLVDARLTRAILVEATLSLAALSRADLTDATLLDARLIQVQLTGATLRGAVLARARIVDADLSRADLTGADLSYASLINVNLSGAKLRGCVVYGIGAWDLRTDGETDQRDLTVSRPDEPRVTVDEVDVAQFIRLLMTHAKLRNVLNAVTKRGVLLLGRFTDGGLEMLQEAAEWLRGAGYLPMIFDFARPETRSYTETVQTLAGLCRFVVADLSGPSVPQELYATVPHFKIPFVPLVRVGQRPYGMFADLLEYPWVLEPVAYADTADLVRLFQESIVAPAEHRHAVRQAQLDRLFPQ